MKINEKNNKGLKFFIEKWKNNGWKMKKKTEKNDEIVKWKIKLRNQGKQPKKENRKKLIF